MIDFKNGNKRKERAQKRSQCKRHTQIEKKLGVSIFNDLHVYTWDVITSVYTVFRPSENK